MRSRVRSLVLGLVALPIALAHAAPPPVSGYAALPQFDGFDVSASGHRILMLRPVGDAQHLVVMDLQAATNRLVLASDPTKFLFNWCRFANEARIVCSVRAYITLRSGDPFAYYTDGRTTVTRLFGVNYDGGDFTELIPDAVINPGQDLVYNAQIQDRVISWLPRESDQVLLQLNRGNRNYPSVFRLDIKANKLALAMRPRPPITFWAANDAGDVLLGVGYRKLEPVFVVRDGKSFAEVDPKRYRSDQSFDLVSFTADNQSVYAVFDKGDGRRALHEVRLRDLEVTRTLFADPDYDVSGRVVTDPRTRIPLGVAYNRDRLTVAWLDDTWRERFADIDRALPGTTNEPVSWSEDGHVIVVRSRAPRAVPVFYLYDAGAKNMRSFGASHPDISAENVVEQQPVSYVASDGLRIPAYLAVPRGAKPEKLPTIIFPHGGPYGRDTGDFDYWVQFFVSRGYAVLQPNFRGSTGYGTKYLELGFEQWGERMQDDVIDGLDWLIAEGITDANRVCIVGGSYGGYVALVAAYKTPERFRCAVSFAGVSNLPAMVANLYRYQFGQLTRVRIQSGDALVRDSALYNVDRIGIPLLLAHGDQDRVVFIEQSIELARALEKAGKPFKFIRQPGGDHFLSTASQRLQFFEAMDAFLHDHLQN